MARPKLDIDANEVQKLASFGCTNTEIAEFFNCNEATIRKGFSEYLTKGRSMKKIRLRQIQWKIAENGSCAMAIFLGKNILNQSDNGMMEDDDTPLPFNVE
tara:strand:+ start:1171 stop:1473 length:303 start_codon:yes stop_codon:yes gene_type:complete